VKPLSEREAEALITWRAAVILCVITAIGPVAGFLNFPAAGRALFISRVVAIGWSLALLALLLAQSERKILWLSRLAYGFAPLPNFPMYWLVASERNLRGLPFDLFLREYVMVMVYALTTPPSVPISLCGIAAFTLQNLLLYRFRPYPLELQTAHLEPWTSLLWGASAMVVAFYRAHRQRREVMLIVQAERASALKRLLRAYLAIGDLLNTPLQTLRFAISLFATRHPEEQELTSKMERAVEGMHELNQVLATKASAGEWRPGDEAFDPLEVLRATGRE
jgi:hypothetical protein